MIDRCFPAIEAVDYSRTEFEVLIVDDGSVSPPDEVIARYAPLLPLRCFRTPRLGPARARDLALRETRGQYTVFTDDDCAPQPEWLRVFDDAIAQHPGAGLGGRIMDSPRNGLAGRTSQMLDTYLYHYTEASDRLRFFCSNNFAFPRRELLDLGSFDDLSL